MAREKQKGCLAEVLRLIKARTVYDLYVKNNCIVLEKHIPRYNNSSSVALCFDCLAALDGSAAVTHFHRTKLGKTKCKGEKIAFWK